MPVDVYDSGVFVSMAFLPKAFLDMNLEVYDLSGDKVDDVVV